MMLHFLHLLVDQNEIRALNHFRVRYHAISYDYFIFSITLNALPYRQVNKFEAHYNIAIVKRSKL